MEERTDLIAREGGNIIRGEGRREMWSGRRSVADEKEGKKEKRKGRRKEGGDGEACS